MKKNKYFIISVDTEGDNQWDNAHEISTENTYYLPRFQELCEKSGFKPVWLTTYEMAENADYVTYMKKKQNDGFCEIGMHLHAWSTPPEYQIHQKTDQRPFLVEYPETVMRQKIMNMTDLLRDRFGKMPVSHRSGRWIMNEKYYSILAEMGYLVDCSVTPLISWKNTQGATGICGCDYSNAPENPYFRNDGILEIPVTIRKMHFFNRDKVTDLYTALRETRNLLTGVDQWMRPFDTQSGLGMDYLLKKVNAECGDILFTLHSSELMPGGSPIFKTRVDIEILYGIIAETFAKARSMGYVGCTMREYYELLKNN